MADDLPGRGARRWRRLGGLHAGVRKREGDGQRLGRGGRWLCVPVQDDRFWSGVVVGMGLKQRETSTRPVALQVFDKITAKGIDGCELGKGRCGS
jgi:hypothetical protein